MGLTCRLQESFGEGFLNDLFSKLGCAVVLGLTVSRPQGPPVRWSTWSARMSGGGAGGTPRVSSTPGSWWLTDEDGSQRPLREFGTGRVDGFRCRICCTSSR